MLHFVENVHIVKDNMFALPPLFKLIQEESKTHWKEMYKVFNMGHRMELYVSSDIANDIINISESFNVNAKIIGRVESCEGKKLTIDSKYGTFIVNMLDKLSAINDRYLEVERLISSSDVTNDMKLFVKLSKEYKDLEPIIKGYIKITKIYCQILLKLKKFCLIQMI